MIFEPKFDPLYHQSLIDAARNAVDGRGRAQRLTLGELTLEQSNASVRIDVSANGQNVVAVFDGAIVVRPLPAGTVLFKVPHGILPTIPNDWPLPVDWFDEPRRWGTTPPALRIDGRTGECAIPFDAPEACHLLSLTGSRIAIEPSRRVLAPLIDLVGGDPKSVESGCDAPRGKFLSPPPEHATGDV